MTQDLETSFSGRTVNVGDRVTGKVVKITGSVAFVDFGSRSQGYIQLSEFRDAEGNLNVAEGLEVEAEVVNTRSGVELSHKKARESEVQDQLKKAWKAGESVEGRIVATNKGGFEVRVLGVRAFCPASQLAERFIKEPAREVGKTYDFKITAWSDKGLVLSRRGLIEERRQQDNERVKVGDRLQGRVTQLQDFGAFVDLGEGIEGMVHVSEISHARIAHPREKVNVGDAIEVEVIKLDAEKGRIGLSMKALETDPRAQINAERAQFVDGLSVGQVIEGKVERIQPFGAFVNLAPGIDGLLHVSGLSATERVNDPAEKLTAGQTVQVVIERIEKEKGRIALVTPEVWEARKPVPLTLKVGDVVKGVVKRHEKYGVFLEVAPRVQGLMPVQESATERNTEMSRAFPLETEVEVKVIEIEEGEKLRIRLSRKAMLTNEEDQAYDNWRKQANSQPASKSMGTFGDLLKDFLKK